MPFVKLDTRILDSTLWVERECREIFITALLMAEPREVTELMPQLKVRTLDLTGFDVPPGWYGFVPCAGIGIIRRAMVSESAGYEALEKLGSPDLESRSNEFDGRRVVRVDGGFVVLNYMKYRDRDHGSAERMRRLRSRKSASRLRVTVTQEEVESREVTPVHPNVTQAESREQRAEDRVKTKNQSRASALVLPDWIPRDPWNGFLEMRRKAGKAPTDRALGLLVKKLAALLASGQDPGEVLDQSTERSWLGLFEVKSQGSRRRGPSDGCSTEAMKGGPALRAVTGLDSHPAITGELEAFRAKQLATARERERL